MPPRPWTRPAPPANTKRRDSKLWSETFDVRLGHQMLSSKEIKRQEVRVTMGEHCYKMIENTWSLLLYSVMQRLDQKVFVWL